jgi:heat shock protein HslJ
MVDVIWVLTAVERVPQQNVENTFGTGITLEFHSDGTASGSGGCNDYSATYTAGAGNSLTFGPAAATRKFCSPEAVMNLESEYFAALSSVTSYTLNQSDLSLTYNNGQSQLDFVFIGATSGPAGMPTTGGGDALPVLALLAIISALGVVSGLVIRRHANRRAV